MPDLAGTKAAYYGFTGIIDPNGATRLCSAFNLAVNNGFDEINLCFSSMGGYVADGVYLYNYIRGLPAKIVIYNIGTVSSIAVTVFVGAAERYCSTHSVFMIHPTTISSSEGMSAERLQSNMSAALADDERTEKILRERTSIPDDILCARRTKDVHILPDQAVDIGLVQGVREFSLPRGHQIAQI